MKDAFGLFDNATRGVNNTGISVSALTERMRRVVAAASELQGVWVVAELTEVRASGGHVYVELAEKDDAGNIVAKLRGNIWRNVCTRMGASYGRQRMLELIKTGSEVLVYGSVNYSPLYSVAFNITDIDPTYVRDTNRLQAQIIATLKAEGILEANKQLSLCEAPQRIAVISAAGAAGYGDFMNQLLRNPYRLRFDTELFSAVMQGASVTTTVRAALDCIEQRADEFDCVVIIRGGGATTDLAGFDEVQLARAVALFPLPIIVGIGHERDNTVLDFIAHTRVKTPTAAAEFLVARNAAILARITDLTKYIASYAQKMVYGEHRQLEFYADKVPTLASNRIRDVRLRLNELTAALPLLVQNRLVKARSGLDNASRAIEGSVQRRITVESVRLETMRKSLERDLQVSLTRAGTLLQSIEDKVRLLSPQNVLRRGYSITTHEGHAVRNADDIKPGARLVTRLEHGTLTSTAD